MEVRENPYTARKRLNMCPCPRLGADIVGINCHFDPFICVEAVKKMKQGIEKAGLKCHYMVQPLGYITPDCGKQGFIDLPEFPFGKFSISVTTGHWKYF